jgi:low affinity Fe/Cu permease
MEVKKTPLFEILASKATRIAGSTASFLIACTIIIGWLICGPIFNYSDTWQLVINTSTTIITFLMVFLIQKTQNKDAIAIQIKLNELVAANKSASNRIVDVEDLSEAELLRLHDYYSRLAEKTKSEKDRHALHSIDESIVKEVKEKEEIKKAPAKKQK